MAIQIIVAIAKCVYIFAAKMKQLWSDVCVFVIQGLYNVFCVHCDMIHDE